MKVVSLKQLRHESVFRPDFTHDSTNAIPLEFPDEPSDKQASATPAFGQDIEMGMSGILGVEVVERLAPDNLT